MQKAPIANIHIIATKQPIWKSRSESRIWYILQYVPRRKAPRPYHWESTPYTRAHLYFERNLQKINFDIGVFYNMSVSQVKEQEIRE